MRKNEKIVTTIRDENEFEMVFKKGRIVRNEKSNVRAHFLFIRNGESKYIKVAVSVSSKIGNSVYRNRFKRFIRESLRLEINTLKELIDNLRAGLMIVFSPYKLNQKNKKRFYLKDIRENVSDILIFIWREIKQQNPA